MIRLEEVGCGVVAEKFDDEITRVVKNIMDINTEAKPVREITLKLKIKPDPEDRSSCSLEVSSWSKLAPTKSYVSKMNVGIDRSTGEVDAEEIVSMQPYLFPKTREVA